MPNKPESESPSTEEIEQSSDEKYKSTDQTVLTSKSKIDKEKREEIAAMKKAYREEYGETLAPNSKLSYNNQPNKSGLYRAADGKIRLPSACSLVSEKLMAKWLKLSEDELTLKDGNPRGKDSRSCFFKWDDPDWPNTAVLIQIMRNPVEKEAMDWPTYFIDSKRETGEQQMIGEDEISYLFKKYDEFGDDGAFSYEQSKWFWRIGNDAIVMIAFNMDGSNKKKERLVKKIGAEIMKSLQPN